ncbi:hypothetical protein EB155_00125 [archaeon]|jgi:hypothetical protein|nr:hypothetical protein [archaeon]NDB54221.1 hypothetical protein [archaeon]NDB78251.1 hypothetical protein [archaeon]NDF27875.1 hypothetical protein [archaeon]
MKINVEVIIEIIANEESDKLLDILKPENDDIENLNVKSYSDSGKVITELSGDTKIGTLQRTIDDIISTAVLAMDIFNSADKLDQIE